MQLAAAQLVNEPRGFLNRVIQAEFIDEHRVQFWNVRSSLLLNGGESQLDLRCWNVLLDQKFRQMLGRDFGIYLGKVVHQVGLLVDLEKVKNHVDQRVDKPRPIGRPLVFVNASEQILPERLILLHRRGMGSLSSLKRRGSGAEDGPTRDEIPR